MPLIAVVDDDPSVLKSLARTLRLSGYEVSAFGSAEEFLGSLATRPPQCLVLDVHMPGMSGLELQSRLRELECRLPIVFITAHDMPQIQTAASPSESIALLSKPFGNTALLTAVGSAVQHAPLQHQGP